MSYRVWWQRGWGIDKPKMKEGEGVHNIKKKRKKFEI
jgi:hypothetical protein